MIFQVPEQNILRRDTDRAGIFKLSKESDETVSIQARLGSYAAWHLRGRIAGHNYHIKLDGLDVVLEKP